VVAIIVPPLHQPQSIFPNARYNVHGGMLGGVFRWQSHRTAALSDWLLLRWQHLIIIGGVVCAAAAGVVVSTAIVVATMAVMTMGIVRRGRHALHARHGLHAFGRVRHLGKVDALDATPNFRANVHVKAAPVVTSCCSLVSTSTILLIILKDRRPHPDALLLFERGRIEHPAFRHVNAGTEPRRHGQSLGVGVDDASHENFARPGPKDHHGKGALIIGASAGAQCRGPRGLQAELVVAAHDEARVHEDAVRVFGVNVGVQQGGGVGRVHQLGGGNGYRVGDEFDGEHDNSMC